LVCTFNKIYVFKVQDYCLYCMIGVKCTGLITIENR